MISEATLIGLLYDALRSPIGVAVESESAEILRQKLYPLRKRDPDFDCLSFLISPVNSADLWIIKQGTSDAAS